MPTCEKKSLDDNEVKNPLRCQANDHIVAQAKFNEKLKTVSTSKGLNVSLHPIEPGTLKAMQ